MKYYVATNTGVGFITNEDNETGHIQGFIGDIYVTDNEAWAIRVDATELNRELAQNKVNQARSKALAERKAYINSMPESEEKTAAMLSFVEERDIEIVLP